MEKKLIETKQEVITFLLGTFTITFIMGIVMFFVYKGLNKTEASSFAFVQMLYPALVAIIIKIYKEKSSLNKDVILFFKLYIILCCLSLITLITGVFIFPKNISDTLNILLCFFSAITFILVVTDKDDCFKNISMKIDKNSKDVLLFSLLFIGLKFIITVINGIAYGNLVNTMKSTLHTFVLFPMLLPVNVILCYIIFFGEELGWRGFLQPRLQVLFGKRLGVIVLGFIWGIWHLPLCLMLYSPATPVHCVIFYIFYCTLIGIFMGFIYMRTENLWSVIIVHLINNAMVADVNNAYGTTITSKYLILSIVSCTIVFLPFIFAKEYKWQPHNL